MSGLVAYDSSSEDESYKTVAGPAHAANDTRPSVNGSSTEQHISRATEVTDNELSAMIGPTAPTAEPDRSRIEDLDELPEDMSEQDLIRHLTRAPYPMMTMPPSPPGSPDPATEDRFKKFLDLKAKGMHFNEDLAKKSSFRNPALLSSLLDRNGLDGDNQYATSLPLTVWDPSGLPTYAYKEELARNQQALRDQQTARKKEATLSGRRTIDFAPATGSGSSSRTSTPGGQRSERRGFGS